MTIKLTSAFFKNARGVTFLDSASITWAFDKNANVISAGAGVGPPSGLSVSITTAKLTSGGSNGSMTFTNGVLTAQTAAT